MRAVAGRSREDRHAAAVGGREQAACPRGRSASSRAARYLPTRWWNSAVPIVFWNASPRQSVRIEAVGAEQVLVVEDDVVDADDLVLAQLQVGEARPGLVQVHAEGEVRVVVEVRAGGDDPVDEAGLDERHEARHAQPGRRQRAARATGRPCRSFASILLAKSWHASRSRPALYDRNAESMRSAAATPARDRLWVNPLAADLLQELLVLRASGVAIVVRLVGMHGVGILDTRVFVILCITFQILVRAGQLA